MASSNFKSLNASIIFLIIVAICILVVSATTTSWLEIGIKNSTDIYSIGLFYYCKPGRCVTYLDSSSAEMSDALKNLQIMVCLGVGMDIILFLMNVIYCRMKGDSYKILLVSSIICSGVSLGSFGYFIEMERTHDKLVDFSTIDLSSNTSIGFSAHMTWVSAILVFFAGLLSFQVGRLNKRIMLDSEEANTSADSVSIRSNSDLGEQPLPFWTTGTEIYPASTYMPSMSIPYAPHYNNKRVKNDNNNIHSSPPNRTRRRDTRLHDDSALSLPYETRTPSLEYETVTPDLLSWPYETDPSHKPHNRNHTTQYQFYTGQPSVSSLPRVTTSYTPHNRGFNDWYSSTSHLGPKPDSVSYNPPNPSNLGSHSSQLRSGNHTRNLHTPSTDNKWHSNTPDTIPHKWQPPVKLPAENPFQKNRGDEGGEQHSRKKGITRFLGKAFSRAVEEGIPDDVGDAFGAAMELAEPEEFGISGVADVATAVGSRVLHQAANMGRSEEFSTRNKKHGRLGLKPDPVSYIPPNPLNLGIESKKYHDDEGGEQHSRKKGITRFLGKVFSRAVEGGIPDDVGDAFGAAMELAEPEEFGISGVADVATAVGSRVLHQAANMGESEEFSTRNKKPDKKKKTLGALSMGLRMANAASNAVDYLDE